MIVVWSDNGDGDAHGGGMRVAAAPGQRARVWLLRQGMQYTVGALQQARITATCEEL